jgi:serine/threonine-protein kinase RsbT
MESENHLTIASEHDILRARQRGRELAEQMGFFGTDLTILATAISEIVRNIVQYARRGEVSFAGVQEGGRWGILVVARDEGPGIPDIDQAMQDGFSTGRSLGLGLPGARRLMDEFHVASQPGAGTVVTMKKWMRSPSSRAR